MSEITESQSLEVVEDPYTWGPCEHTEEPVLLGIGEERPESVLLVELPDGRTEEHRYYDQNSPVVYIAQVECPVCRARQVFRRDRPFEVVQETPAPVPPPALVDLDDAEDISPTGEPETSP